MNSFLKSNDLVLLQLHLNNLIYGENVLNKIYICAIIEVDWKWLGFFIELTDDNNIR